MQQALETAMKEERATKQEQEEVIDLCIEHQPVFQFQQYAKGAILRPIPTYRQTYYEE